MPRKRADKIKNTEEAFEILSKKLRQQVVAPDINSYEPHPKQIAFHSAKETGRQFIGGNRSGKTVGGGSETVWWLTGTHPYQETPKPPVHGRAVGVDFIQGVAKIIMPQIRQRLPEKFLKNGKWEDSYDKEMRTLTLNNGSTLEFMSYDQDLEKFAGTSRDFMWFDEEPPKAIFQECLMRLIDKEGKWWMTMTPVDGMTWTFDDIYDKDDDDIFVVEVDMDDNPHVTQRGKDIILKNLNKDEYDTRKKGKYINAAGLIYKRFDFDRHVIDPFIPPKEWLWFRGMDHGFTNPTAWLWATVNPDGDIFIFDEYYESGLIVSDHAKTLHRKDAEYRKIPDYNVGDPSIRNVDPITGTSILIEYAINGVPILLGNNDVQAGLIRVQERLKGTELSDGTFRPRLYITSNCVNTLKEMRKYSWAMWRDRKSNYAKNKKEEPQKKDDHAMDAMRYLVASRPEHDNGKQPPQDVQAPPVSHHAINPDEPRIDNELASVGSKSADPHLGEYY